MTHEADHPYRGTVLVIPEGVWARPRTGDVPLLVLLVINCFVAGVLMSGG